MFLGTYQEGTVGESDTTSINMGSDPARFSGSKDKKESSDSFKMEHDDEGSDSDSDSEVESDYKGNRKVADK